MKAYKFRGPGQIQFALDIIFNQRLFCANWTALNDPMEGAFQPRSILAANGGRRKQVEQIIEEKMKLRVCSLAKDFRSHLLWAHYAEGFSGLAIEVELPSHTDEITPVDYREAHAWTTSLEVISPPQAAREILSSKFKEWTYEGEVRVLQQGEWYELSKPVKRIICGHRMAPSLYQALEIICERQEIEILRTHITEKGVRSLADFDMS